MSQAPGRCHGCRLGGRFMWAIIRHWIIIGLWGSLLSVAPQGCGEGLLGVLHQRVAEMELKREVFVVCVWLIFGGEIGTMACCRV